MPRIWQNLVGGRVVGPWHTPLDTPGSVVEPQSCDLVEMEDCPIFQRFLEPVAEARLEGRVIVAASMRQCMSSL